MTKISKEELLKLAEISRLQLYENEIEPLAKQLQDVLTYAERVSEAASADVAYPSAKNINTFREDVVVKTDPQPLLAQAPEEEEHYFVVPKTIDSK